MVPVTLRASPTRDFRLGFSFPSEQDDGRLHLILDSVAQVNRGGPGRPLLPSDQPLSYRQDARGFLKRTTRKRAPEALDVLPLGAIVRAVSDGYPQLKRAFERGLTHPRPLGSAGLTYVAFEEGHRDGRARAVTLPVGGEEVTVLIAPARARAQVLGGPSICNQSTARDHPPGRLGGPPRCR